MQHWINEAILIEAKVLDGQLLSKIVPSCVDPHAWANALRGRLEFNGIESNHDIALFLAHAGHESGSFNQLEESLNYGVEALHKLFGSHRITSEQVEALGRKPGQSANQEELGNVLYGGKWGKDNLGNLEYGDGYKYRGRGIFQLTGLYNYTRCAEATGIDFVNQPELLAEDKDAAVESAIWYWNTRVSGGDVRTTTKQINGGYHGLADRIDRYKWAMSVLESDV